MTLRKQPGQFGVSGERNHNKGRKEEEKACLPGLKAFNGGEE